MLSWISSLKYLRAFFVTSASTTAGSIITYYLFAPNDKTKKLNSELDDINKENKSLQSRIEEKTEEFQKINIENLVSVAKHFCYEEQMKKYNSETGFFSIGTAEFEEKCNKITSNNIPKEYLKDET